MKEFKLEEIAPHTEKKIELVEKYVKAWAQKLLNYSPQINPSSSTTCENLYFIDCMSNCGEYRDKHSNRIIKGTPYRVSKYFHDIASKYPSKHLCAIFNDLDKSKTDHLNKLLQDDGVFSYNNYSCIIKVQDANQLLSEIASEVLNKPNTHYLLFYDPYQADINWEVLAPFFNRWGELIINHMVSDTIRAVPVVKSEEAKIKYSSTYLTEFQDLLPFGTDVKAYEELFESNIRKFRTNDREYYISFFPFHNSNNALVYDLVHCTSSFEGFKLYKQCAWKVFGGQSSNKDRYGADKQLTLFDNSSGTRRDIDEKCYTLNDIVDFVIRNFLGKGEIAKSVIWDLLDRHPFFSSAPFKREIVSMLEKRGCEAKLSSIVFNRKSK